MLAEDAPLLCTPEYLHAKHAFGVWSLPDRSNPKQARVEDRLEDYLDYYVKAVDQHRWYGFWNYGDFMHPYDSVRHTWRYDVGGYAWETRNWPPICGCGTVSCAPAVPTFGGWPWL